MNARDFLDGFEKWKAQFRIDLESAAKDIEKARGLGTPFKKKLQLSDGFYAEIEYIPEKDEYPKTKLKQYKFITLAFIPKIKIVDDEQYPYHYEIKDWLTDTYFSAEGIIDLSYFERIAREELDVDDK